VREEEEEKGRKRGDDGIGREVEAVAVGGEGGGVSPYPIIYKLVLLMKFLVVFVVD